MYVKELPGLGDGWQVLKNPWSEFPEGIQSSGVVSASIFTSSPFTIAVASVPDAFSKTLAGSFYSPEYPRRSFPKNGFKHDTQKDIAKNLEVLGKDATGSWRLACCDEFQGDQGHYFWAGTISNTKLILLDDKGQASSLPVVYLPQGVDSVEKEVTGWQWQKVDGLSVLFSKAGEGQELTWSLDSLSGWFKLQAWTAPGSTDEANYEVYASDQELLRPLAGQQTVTPDKRSEFKDIGTYHLAKETDLVVKLTPPTDSTVSAAYIRVIRPSQ